MLIQCTRRARWLINYLLRCAANERPIAAIGFVIREAMRLARDRWRARVVGWPGSYLGAGAKVIGSNAIQVGPNAQIKRAAWIEAVFTYNAQVFSPSISIGRNFYCSERLHISAINQVQIGDDCLFGSGVYISDHNHGVYRGPRQSSPDEPPVARTLGSTGAVTIGARVWLGDNVIIVGPVNIGNGCIIGANSIVTHDLPDNVIAAGAPVRILKSFRAVTGKWEPCADSPPQVR